MTDTTTDRVAGRGRTGLLIDRHLPRYDETVVRNRVVDAPVAATYDAAMMADFTQTGPVVRALNELRALPIRIGAWLRGEAPPSTTDPLRLRDLPEVGTWVRLDETEGEEIVFGAIGAVWQPDIEWVEVDAETVDDFDAPGYAKIAAGISIRPYGEGRTLVTYEARTAATDANSRRRFRRYWGLVGPFAGYMMGRALDRIAADAEAATG